MQPRPPDRALTLFDPLFARAALVVEGAGNERGAPALAARVAGALPLAAPSGEHK